MVGKDESTITSLIGLSSDHHIAWAARLSSAALLSRLVAHGGPASEAAVRLGSFSALLEIMDRDMYPFYRQVVACLAWARNSHL